MFKHLKIPAVLAAAALLAVSCSSGGNDSSASPSPTAPTSDTVRLLTYESFAISEATLEAFTKETGLKVEVIKAGDAGAMVNRALLTKENPEGDLLFGVDNNLVSRTLEEELFVQYEAANADNISPEDRRDVDGRLTPIDSGDVCINYDVAAFGGKNPEPPQSLEDLKKPEYKDMLVVENPTTSTPGLAFLLATVKTFGDPGYQEYWASLRDNGVKVVNSWSDAYSGQFSGASGSSGDRPIVVSYASSPAAEVIFAEKKPEQAPTKAALATCYVQIEFAGVLSNAANDIGAKMLLDFMLTPTYQDDIPLNNFVYPVLADAKLPAEFEEYAPEPENPIEIPSAEVAEKRDEWLKGWNETMQR